MLQIDASEEWKATHPGAQIGLLEISRVDNSLSSQALDQEKRAVEQRLREQFSGYARTDFLELPVMGAYHRYYRRFGYTYHVLLQLESIVLKGKSLPSISPLVDANFAAEVDTLILTAGHDVARLTPPLLVDVAREADEITQMSGNRKQVPEGDMLMRDQEGLICTILRGQDDRSPISKGTSHVLYVSYVPEGVTEAQVRAQLKAIEGYVRLFSPDRKVQQSTLICA